MKKTKAQNGITLVALIITIIVLLILVVVAISAVQDSGIITYAKNSKETYTVAQEKEQIQLALDGWFIEKRTATEPDAYKTYMTSELSDVATVTGEKTLIVTFNETGNQYLLNENWEQVSTVTDLEKYIFGQDLMGRSIFDIAVLKNQDLFTFTFLDDPITSSINEKEKVIYSDTGVELINDQETLVLYFKYENEFYKFAVNMDSRNTDVNYGLIKLPKVDTSNYSILEKYFFGEHGQGRCIYLLMGDDGEGFRDHPATIPDASTKLIPITGTQEGVLYFKYEDEIYKVLANQTTYNMDPNYGVVKLEQLEEGTEVGKIVEYDGARWTILYADDINGLQMIRNNTTSIVRLQNLNSLIENPEEVKIADLNKDGVINNGLDTIEKRLYAYNMAIELLNKVCDNKVSDHEYIEEVRCVGSDPVRKNSENSKRYTSAKLEEWPINFKTYPVGVYNGRAKSTDQNYISDYERMLLLGIAASDREYWLASRMVVVDAEDIRFFVRTCEGTSLNGIYEARVSESGISGLGAGSEAWLRPVVKLDPNVEFDGLGTYEKPYTFKSSN